MKTTYKQKLVIACLAGCCFATAAATLLTSCSDEMNYNETYVYDKEYMTEIFGRAEGFLTTAYNEVDYDFGQNMSGAMLASASDEAEYAYTGNSVEDYYNGSWSATNPHSTMWTSAFKGIRYANLYLAEFANLSFDNLKYNDDYQAQMFNYNNMKYEARFLRAYFYFNLVRQYGGVPIMTENLSADEVNQLSRNSSDEVFEFINSECDAIKDSIIKDYTDLGDNALTTVPTGRANQLAVLALKARAALYHASPLFNPSNDKELWHQAATACKQLLDSATAQGKKLARTYNSLWSSNNYSDAQPFGEILFIRNVGETNQWEKYNFPVGLENCSGGNCPTQDLVDAYEMQKTGLGINEEGSGYNAAKPYNGRDPRFELTICHNESKRWPNWATDLIYTYYGGANALPLNGGTPTGYYLKKLLNAATDTRPATANTTRHNWVVFRLGEAYLNYAEAVFQYLGSADATSTEFPMSAREAASKTRERVRMPAFPTGMSNDAFYEKLKNERRVELAFEGHRFWDVRRWKEADKYFDHITEMHIYKNDDGSYTYTPKTVSRRWEDKMYFFPIPQSELLKDKNLTQNTGW